MRTSLALALVSVLAGCSKKAEPPGPAPTGTPGSAAHDVKTKPAAVTDAGVAQAKQAAAGSGSGATAADAKAPLTAEQKAAIVAYRVAMARGRKATDAKGYADAIAAFDDALKARPNDPRAYAERGFAKLLAGTDLAAASADFDHAADGTRDPKLLGMIWFNRGLTDDKLARPDAALVDYYLANQLLPSKAAAGELAGKTVCPLRVESPDERSAAAFVDAADWLALATKLDLLDTLDQPKTNAAARLAILGPDTKPELPIAVTLGSSYGGKTAYIVLARGGALRAVPVAMEVGGRCSGSVGAGVVTVQGDLVYARAAEQVGGGITAMCHVGSGDDGVIKECTGADDEEHQGNACDDTGTTLRDVVLDKKSGKVLFVAEQAQPPDPDGKGIPATDARLVQVSLGAGGLHLSGIGCEQVVPFGAPAAGPR